MDTIEKICLIFVTCFLLLLISMCSISMYNDSIKNKIACEQLTKIAKTAEDFKAVNRFCHD